MLKSGFSERTQKYMESVYNYIKETQGGVVPQEYQASLQILAVNYELYMELIDDIRERGIVIRGEFGDYENKSFASAKQCERMICAVCKDFGLNTFSRSKIKLQEAGISIEDVIGELTS